MRDSLNSPTLNPLIGAGVNESPDGLPNAAGNTILAHTYFGKSDFLFPALQDPADFPSASEHFWDWDADGFGNRRISINILFSPTNNPIGDIDIGADEVGDIVISGYLNSSRIFSQTPNVGSGPVQLTRSAIEQFYFGAAATSLSQRPYHNALVGKIGAWYQHIESFGLAGTIPQGIGIPSISIGSPISGEMGPAGPGHRPTQEVCQDSARHR